MKLFGLIKLLALLVAVDLGTLATAAAQQVSPPSSKTDDTFTYFYRDPRPERLVGWFDAYGKEHPDWEAYPPVAGFFAVVFAAQPGWIERLVPAQLNARQAETISAALRLSSQPTVSKDLQARLVGAGTDPTLAAQFAGLPNRLTNLRIATPTHLDILWGASFASGDGRYTLMIADFFARTTNRSEPIALGVTRIAAAISRQNYNGLAQLKDKYEPGLLLEMTYAATAAWALTSNARQHAFVDRVVTRYISEHPGTLAVQLLSAMKGS